MGWQDKVKQVIESGRQSYETAREEMPWTARRVDNALDPVRDKITEYKEKIELNSAREVMKQDFNNASNAQDPAELVKQKAMEAIERFEARKAEQASADTLPAPHSKVIQPDNTADVNPAEPANETVPDNENQNQADYRGSFARTLDHSPEPGISNDFNNTVNLPEPPPVPKEAIAEKQPQTLDNASLSEGPKPPYEIESAVKADVQAAAYAATYEATTTTAPEPAPTTAESFNNAADYSADTSSSYGSVSSPGEVSAPDLSTSFNNNASPD